MFSKTRLNDEYGQFTNLLMPVEPQYSPNAAGG